MELAHIEDTVMQVADAITAAIGIETEIVDDKLKIIGGTGRYAAKLGTYEEGGDLDSPYIYAEILRSGIEYVCLDIDEDAMYYSPVEEELAEIACPIKLGTETIGIIGLVAFTEEQRGRMETGRSSLLNFLRRMSELISGKLVEAQSSRKLAALLESMPDGLMAVDSSGCIFSCNFAAEQLFGRSRDELTGRSIADLIPESELTAGDMGSHTEREMICSGGKRLMVSTIPIPDHGVMMLFKDYERETRNAGEMTRINNKVTFDDIYGVSGKMKGLKQRAMQVSDGTSTILITGESGTGKEMFARAIHARSHRADKPFIAINCAAIPDALLESELFGYEKGAFTGADRKGRPGKFELADHGTIFLDEIGDMPLHMQVKILRVLQNRTVERIGGTSSLDIDVRIIAATNKDLEEMISRNEFREDLYFRLNVIPLHIPSLRERTDDIGYMLDGALRKFNAIVGKNIEGFSDESLKILNDYNWPGNVRELENVVEYAVNMENSRMIQPENLPERLKHRTGIPYRSGEGTLKEQTSYAQKVIIEDALKKSGSGREGKRKAAERLGISESSLYRKMQELGLKN